MGIEELLELSKRNEPGIGGTTFRAGVACIARIVEAKREAQLCVRGPGKFGTTRDLILETVNLHEIMKINLP